LLPAQKAASRLAILATASSGLPCLPVVSCKFPPETLGQPVYPGGLSLIFGLISLLESFHICTPNNNSRTFKKAGIEATALDS
jgi:hypothetical protein